MEVGRLFVHSDLPCKAVMKQGQLVNLFDEVVNPRQKSKGFVRGFVFLSFLRALTLLCDLQGCQDRHCKQSIAAF
mgnify:CR=1 FL=1